VHRIHADVDIFAPDAQLNMRLLCEAVSIDVRASSLDPRKRVDAEEVLISCSSLVRLSADGDHMEAAHFTVEEYLQAIDPVRKPHLARFRLSEDLANHYKATLCLSTLLFDNVVVDILKNGLSLLLWLQQFPFYFHVATS
jgi:hypothetical protein